MNRCFQVRFRFLIFMGLALLGGSAVVSQLQAQLLQGSITGNVTDASGAAVPDAKVTAKEQQTNFTRETTTNSGGVYNLPTMPPGTYAVIVTAPSFQTTTVTGVLVSPEEVTRRDVALAVGQEPKRGSEGRGSGFAVGLRRCAGRSKRQPVAECAGTHRPELPESVYYASRRLPIISG